MLANPSPTLANPSLSHCLVHHLISEPLSRPPFGHHFSHYFTALDFWSDSDACLLGDNGVDFQFYSISSSMIQPIGNRVNWRENNLILRANENIKIVHEWKHNSSFSTTSTSV